MKEKVKLEEVCSLITDGTHQTPIYSKEGYIFLSSKNVTSGRINWKNVKYISEQLHEQLKKRITPQKNDILLAKNGTTGIAAIVDKDIEFDIYVSLALLRANEKVLPKYLLWAINSPTSKKKFNSNLKGIGVKNLHLNIIKSIEINMYEKKKQQTIVNVLDKLQEILESQKEQLSELEKFSKCLFFEMFKKDKKSWEKVFLENITEIGSSKRVFLNEIVTKGIPFYRGTEIGVLSTGEKIEPTLFITKEHYNELCKSSGVPKKGDLLLPSICNDGRIWCVDTDNLFYFKDGRVLWIKINDKIESKYLQYLLKEEFSTNYEKIASGTTFSELKIFSLKKIKITLPPIELQNKFAERIKLIEKSKFEIQQSIDETQKLFDSLMEKYFG